MAVENPPSPLHDLHVVNAEQLEATYGITTEAVLLTDQAHRQLWANSAYDTLLSSHTHTDACPQAVSLSCYAYHDPASVECRSILWTFIDHTGQQAVPQPTRPMTSHGGGVLRLMRNAAPTAASALVQQYTATLAQAAAEAVARAAAASGLDCHKLLKPRAAGMMLATRAASSSPGAQGLSDEAEKQATLKRRRDKATVQEEAEVVKLQRRRPTKSGKAARPTDDSQRCSNDLNLKRIASERTLEVSSVLASMWSAVL